MGTHRLILIRTDGNVQIAAGHIMRCLAIADACMTLGMEVRFLVSDQESASFLNAQKSDADVTILKTAHYANLERELPELRELLKSTPDPVLLVDSYGVTASYFTALKPFAKLAYLDDLQLFDPPVDLLINYDVIPESRRSVYEQAYSNALVKLLGAPYTPLRSQFLNRHAEIRAHAKDILITTGGTDPEHFCLGLLELLKNPLFPGLSEVISPGFLSCLTFHFVMGSLNADRETLRQAVLAFSASDYSCRILLHEQVTDMASLMLTCDLAVSASGTTLYELCALGVPAISFTIADNQIPSALAFDLVQALPCAGDLRKERSLVYEKVFLFIEEMTLSSGNYQKRKSAHVQMCRLIDGNGSARIAQALGRLS